MKHLAVLWDMDGVLVDSEPLHVEKLVAVAARHGVTIDESDFTRAHDFSVPDGKGGMKDASMPLGGAGDKNIYYWMLSKKLDLAEHLSQAAWLDELLEYYVEHKDRLHPRDRMDLTVDNLARDGATQAVVTSGIRRQVNANLSALGPCASKLAFALNADDVKASKPDPEGYLTAKRRILTQFAGRDVPPEDVAFIAVEDSQPGVRAGLAADIHCIQFVLPGQQPMAAPDGKASRLTAAFSRADVEREIRAFAAAEHVVLSAPVARRAPAPAPVA